MSEEFSADEIKELRRLLEIEKIRHVKNLYSQLMDSRDIDGLAAIFSKDAVCQFGPYGEWHGRDEIHKNYKQVFESGGETSPEKYAGFHVTSNHWIEMTGPDTAVGRSYLIDTVHEPDPRTNPIIWLGLDDEEYKKEDGEWKISKCALQFLWPQRMTSEGWPGPFPPK